MPATTKRYVFEIRKQLPLFPSSTNVCGKKKHLSLKTKAQVYRTIVFPNLTYGCETWTWTRSQMSLLEGTQYRFLRTIAGKTWKDKVP